MPQEKHHFDLVIIGAGLAGIRAAIEAKNKVKKIALICKGALFSSGSTFINRNKQWGMTFASTGQESETLYQTIQTISHGTNNPHLTQILVEDSFPAFRELQHWGIDFLRTASGDIKKIRPCFCENSLAVLITDIGQVVKRLKAQLPTTQFTVFDHTTVTSLLLNRNGSCRGAMARRGGKNFNVHAHAFILATGGNGANFTPNIVECGLTGDGYRLAAKTGLHLLNMEFQQRVWEDVNPAANRFSPASFWDKQCVFKNAEGIAITLPDSQSVLSRSRRTHVPISNLQTDRAFDKILLDHLTHDLSSAIHVYDRQTGTLLNRIYPHMQASNGGIVISPDGETGIAGLFAAGEVTTGMHGGDRVGGMMMSNCLVFGRRAAQAAALYIKQVT